MNQHNLDYEWYDKDTSQHTTIDPNLVPFAISSNAVISSKNLSGSWSLSTIQGASGVFDPIGELRDRLEAIEERLGILNIDEHPDNKILRQIYDRYKFTENLIKGKNDE